MEVVPTSDKGERVITVRRLLLLVVAPLLLAASFVPAAAAAPALTTWIVTYDRVPSSYQLDVLKGVTDAVHGFRELPAAVVVAPTAAVTLLRSLPGVRSVYANETYHYLSDLATESSGASRTWSDLGWTGDGVGIAVIDAGVDGSHP